MLSADSLQNTFVVCVHLSLRRTYRLKEYSKRDTFSGAFGSAGNLTSFS